MAGSSTSGAGIPTCRRRPTRSRRCARRRSRPPRRVVHGYPPFHGIADLREAIAERYEADHGVTLDPDREVAVLPGTKTGIMLACVAAAGRGDAILLPDPGYPDYPSGVALASARPERAAARRDAGWQPDFDARRRPAGRPCGSNYPSNPCAVCEHARHVRARRRLVATSAPLAHPRPRLRLPGLRRPPRPQRAGGRGRARVRAGAVVAVEDLRDGGLARRLRRRQRRAREPIQTLLRPHLCRRLHGRRRHRGGAALPPGRRRATPRGLRGPPRPARGHAARGGRGDRPAGGLVLRLVEAPRSAHRRAGALAEARVASRPARASGRAAPARPGCRSRRRTPTSTRPPRAWLPLLKEQPYAEPNVTSGRAMRS